MILYWMGLCFLARAHADNSSSATQLIKARLMLTQSIDSNARAQSFQDWVDSADHPSSLFTSFRAAKMRPETICKALNSLPPEELSVFEHEFNEPANAALVLNCVAALNKKLETYWKQAEAKLSAAQPRLRDLGTERIAPIETQEVVVDASTGPVLVDAGLPEGEIALTFDDGPHPTRTPRVLAILKEAQIRATFFQVGTMARAHPELTQAVYDDHHTVGSHSWSHPQLGRMDASGAEKQILDAKDELESILKISIPFFRFPFGSKNKELQQWVSKSQIATFFWNIDTRDWQIHNPVDLLHSTLKVLDNQHRKGIVLFHDIQAQTVAVLPYFLDALRMRHMKVVVFIPRS